MERKDDHPPVTMHMQVRLTRNQPIDFHVAGANDLFGNYLGR